MRQDKTLRIDLYAAMLRLRLSDLEPSFLQYAVVIELGKLYTPTGTCKEQTKTCYYETCLCTSTYDDLQLGLHINATGRLSANFGSYHERRSIQRKTRPLKRVT